jgi:hypothetical protein
MNDEIMKAAEVYFTLLRQPQVDKNLLADAEHRLNVLTGFDVELKKLEEHFDRVANVAYETSQRTKNT